MIETIQFKRGLEANLPRLADGEPAFCEDTQNVYIGSSSGNKLVFSGSLTDYLNKLGDLTQLQTTDKDTLVHAINDNVASLAQKSQRLSNIWVDVKADYGAKGDGVTDDSQAFINAMSYIQSQAIQDKSYGNITGVYTGKAVLYIPAGTYLITQPEALMSSTYATVTMGLVIKGAGKYITQILFQPTTSGSYLLSNNNKWLHFHVADIQFNSNSMNNHFMHSYSNGNAQNYSFERVAWNGDWGYGLYLDGGNTNSEMSFYHCNINGNNWDTFLYVPSTGSDQFVNYHFYACNFEVGKGNFLKLIKGGSVNIFGGSFMYYSNTSPGGTFFTLGDKNNVSHAGGTMRFMCEGVRFELPSPTGNMIDCSWASGVVTFKNCDNASQGYLNTTDVMRENSIFRSPSGESMPNILFDNCELMGKHRYEYNFATFQRSAKATYKNCEIYHYDEAKDFINCVNVKSDGTADFNKAGAPTIDFEACRGKAGTSQSIHFFDCSLNWNLNYRGKARHRLAYITGADNAFPYASATTESIYLPLGALITKVIMFLPAGSSTSPTAGWQHTIQTNETTPTVLATATPLNNDPRQGFNVIQALSTYFKCDTDAKRQISFIANASVDQAPRNGYCLIEFIS